MRRALPGVRSAVPLCLLLSLACVEQDEDKPIAEDLAAAKQNILTTAPTPRYAVNADLDGKVVYLGLDVDHVPIEPGKDVTLTHYWKVVGPIASEWKLFTRVNGRRQVVHQLRSRGGEGEIPGHLLEGGPDHPRSAQHPAADEL